MKDRTQHVNMYLSWLFICRYFDQFLENFMLADCYCETAGFGFSTGHKFELSSPPIYIYIDIYIYIHTYTIYIGRRSCNNFLQLRLHINVVCVCVCFRLKFCFVWLKICATHCKIESSPSCLHV